MYVLPIQKNISMPIPASKPVINRLTLVLLYPIKYCAVPSNIIGKMNNIKSKKEFADNFIVMFNKRLKIILLIITPIITPVQRQHSKKLFPQIQGAVLALRLHNGALPMFLNLVIIINIFLISSNCLPDYVVYQAFPSISDLHLSLHT